MGTVLKLWIDGIPRPQPRPRAFARQMGNGRAVARVYTPASAEGWKGAVALAVKPHLPFAPLEGPLVVEIHFVLPRPKGLMRRKDPDGQMPHFSKPDGENLSKGTADALTTVGLWRDDGQIYDLRVTKHYAAKTGRPGATLIVRTLEAEEVTP